MASDSEPNTSQYPELQPATPTSHGQLADSASSALAYVSGHDAVELENLEPTLAALSTHSHGVLDGQGHINGDMGLSSISAAVGSVAEIAAQSLAAQPLVSALTDTSQSAKAKRLNRACDACSKRKVKCDNERPCKNCIDLEIECTFQRPTKRRGPINRVAEEIKRHKSTSHGGFTEASVELAPSIFIGLESIAPYSAVKSLVDHYFVFLYPLLSFPLEDIFRDQLDRPEFHDPNFIALVASMCALASSSFPRLVRPAVAELADPGLLENNLQGFIDRCLSNAADARGSRFTLSKRFSVADAATSLLMGLTNSITNSWPQFSLFMTESDRILQCVRLQKKGGNEPANYVEDALESRIYTSLFRATRSISNIGPDFDSLVRPLDAPTLESLSTDSDTDHIYADQDTQPGGFPLLPTTTATNLITSIYVLVSVPKLKSAADDDAESNLKSCFEATRLALESISNLLASAPSSLVAPLTPFDVANATFMPLEQKQAIRLELQKAAIKMASFACRCYMINWLTQRLAQGAGSDVTDASMLIDLESNSIEQDEMIRKANMLVQKETKSLIGDLASFLKGLDIQHVEPHAMSLMTSLNSILPLVDTYRKSSETLHRQTGANSLPHDESAMEDARFVLLQVDQLDKELAVVSRGETINMVDGASS